MFGLLIQGVAISLASWLLWKYFRQIVVKSPLDNVPGPSTSRESFLYGHLKHLVDSNGWDFVQNLTESYNGVAKLQGPLGHRMLYIFDPIAMHNIVVKDQYIYEETAFFIKSFCLSLGPGLLGTLGERHRRQRKMLNPVFSTTHMRRMNSIFNDIGHRLQTAIGQQLEGHKGPVEIDMHSWISRTALELIGQAGLGYSFDPLVEAKPDEFASAIKEFQPTMVELSIWRRVLPYLPEYGSAAFRRKLVDMIPNAQVQKMKSIVDTIHRRSVEIFEEKKRALEQGDKGVTQQVGEGKDIMSILLQANMAASEGDKLPDDELIGQMSTFIMAGMDTTSNALVAILDLLAKNPDVQNKLRDEILEASKGGDLDYDALFSLPYLDAVCRETLRLHPTIGMMFKETRQDVVLPLGQPIRGRDGSLIHEIPIPKDTTVIIGIRSSNRNKAIWGEDALEWKPERWLSPLPATVTEAKIPGIYSHLMTFLGGGRACIGFKFSQHEMKVVLAVLLAKFTFAPSEKPVFWNMSGVRYPTVGTSKEPEMPLVVGLYKPSAI